MRGPLLLLPAGASALLLTVACLFTPPVVRIDVGAPGDTHFLAGFHAAETTGPATFRWTAPDARIVLHGAGPHSLVVVLRAASSESGTRARLSENGRVLAELDLRPGWRPFRVDLPPASGWLPTVEARALTVSCDSYLRGEDGELRGIMLDWIQIEPAPGPWSRTAAARVSLVLLSWLFILWGAAHLALTAIRRWWSSGPRSVPILVALAATLLAILHARDPYRTAWLFPFVPVTLSLVGFSLLLSRNRRGEEATAAEGDRWLSEAPSFRLSPSSVWWLGGVLLLALALRFTHLADLPYGLWRDEARHGLVALRLLEDPSYRPAYEPRIELPMLGIVPLAIGVELFGVEVWSMRPLVAVAGALTVLPLFFLARRLTHRSEIALLAAAFLAVSSAHLHLSRLSFPHVFDPLLTLTGLCLVLLGFDLRGRRAPSVAALGGAGLCFGLALQTYHTGRLAILIGLLLVFLLPTPWRTRATMAGVVLVAFLAAASPLLTYAATHRREFNRRVGTVSLVAHALEDGVAPLRALDSSIGRHLLTFNVRGDENGRHHAPGRPLLDFVSGLGFLAGLVVLLKQLPRGGPRFLLVALALYLLPSILAVDGPHALRALGTVSLACLIAAIGGDALARGMRAPFVALGLSATLALALNAWIYFVALPADPRFFEAFYPAETQLALRVRDLAAARKSVRLPDIYVASDVARSDVFLYLARGISVSTWDEATLSLSRPAGPGALFLVSGLAAPAAADSLARDLGARPEPAALGPPLPDGRPSFYGLVRP